MDLRSKKIGILMGGLSGEREVSLRSGENCAEALQALGYDVARVDALRDVSERLTREGVEVAFLALHGRFGEDGTIQGLLEVMGIPYTGSGVLSSALGMNKIVSKKVAEQSGVPTPPYVEVSAEVSLDEVGRAAEELGLPVILKPVEEGSSLGVVICRSRLELEREVEQGRRRYGRIFVEKCIEGPEITVGLLERDGKLETLPILELVPKNEFYDYEAKYTHGMTEFIIPARLDPEVYRRSLDLSVRAFQALGCSGYARVDFMIDGQGTPYFTEVNTLPGMTDLSDLPAQAREAGISHQELVEAILKTAALDSNRKVQGG